MRLTTEPTTTQLVHAVLLAKQMHEESVYKDMTFNTDKVMRLAVRALEAKDTFILIVAHADNDPNDILGFFLGVVNAHYFSDERIAKDEALFVKKTNRGGIAAIKLIRKFEELAEERGAVFSVLTTETGVEAERTLQLYEHVGYKRLGGICIKHLRT